MDACEHHAGLAQERALETADQGLLSGNLEALARFQPELARGLRDLPVPPDVEARHGRDGIRTFRVAGPHRRPRWLGGSSMPSISAPAILERFDYAGANPLLPTIGTGHEADLLCKRSAPHIAVFAYEQDSLSLKLALSALDLRAHLGAGRLVPLGFAPLSEALAAFIAQHPGYDLPAKMLAHPILSAAQIEELRLEVEAAARAVTLREAKSARELAAAVASQIRSPVPDRPRVALFSSDPRPRSLHILRHLQSAFAALDCPVAAAGPDAPWHCHTLTRLAMIHQHRADFVLLLNCCAGKLAEFLPGDLPVASWFWPDASVSAGTLQGFAGHHLLFAAAPAQCAGLVAAGADPARVHLLQVGVDPSVYTPAEAPSQRLTCDAVILADAPPCTPTALGITLETHVRFWEHARMLMAERALEFRVSQAPRLIADAERAGGISLGSAELRDQFALLVAGPLAQSVVTAATVAHLRGFGLDVRLWGDGWAAYPELAGCIAGPIPEPSERCQIFRSSGAALFPWLDDSAAQALLEAAASGCTPMVPRPEQPWEAAHPQLEGVLGLIPQYDRPKELVSFLRQAAMPDKAFRERCLEIQAVVVRDDSLTARLRELLTRVRHTP